MDCSICEAKTKALISFAVTPKLICVFVFAYSKRSHDAAQILLILQFIGQHRTIQSILRHMLGNFVMLSFVLNLASCFKEIKIHVHDFGHIIRKPVVCQIQSNNDVDQPADLCSPDQHLYFFVPRLFEEKRRDIVFGFPSFRPSVLPSVLPSFRLSVPLI